MPTRFIRYAALVVALLGSSSIAFAQETVPDTRTDRWLTNPVGDATFQTYLEFFAYNKSLPFDVVVGETTTEQGIVRQHVTYQSTQQITVTAYLYRQESPTAGSRGGIIYLHGGTGRGKDAGPGVQLGVLMARDGWTVLAIDLWHYGEHNTGLLTTYTTQEKTDRLYNEPTTYLTFVTQTDGGSEPLWAHSGRELFYRTADSKLIAVQVVRDPAFRLGTQRVLFSVERYEADVFDRNYDVTRDDQRFLMIRQDVGEDEGELILVLNWLEEVKREVGN